MRSDGRVGLAGRRPRRVIEIGRSVVARILEIRWWFVAEIGRRLVAVKRFAAWLAAEEDLDTDGVLAVRPPKLDEVRLTACLGPTTRCHRRSGGHEAIGTYAVVKMADHGPFTWGFGPILGEHRFSSRLCENGRNRRIVDTAAVLASVGDSEGLRACMAFWLIHRGLIRPSSGVSCNKLAIGWI